MTKDVNLSEFYSSFTLSTSLTSLLNDTPLTSFILAILQELLIQSNCHLLGKETPCQSQQSLMMKTRQSGRLRRFWIHDIQDWTVTFSIRFADLIVILILSDIMQMIMSFRTCLKFYMNITYDISINQICSLLNWSWFVISQQEQAEKKSRTWSQRSFQTHYSSLIGFSFGKTVSELWKWSLCSKWRVMLGAVSCQNDANLVETI